MRVFFTLWKMSFLIFPKLSDILKSAISIPLNDKSLSKPWIKNKTDNPYWFSRSGISILVIIKWWEAYTKRESPLIWVPDYFCTETLDLLREMNYKVHFYQIKDTLNPNWEICYSEAIKKKPDLFILVHYFGNQSEIKQARAFCNKFESIFIEDAAHVMVPHNQIGTESDFIFYSQYKLFSIPDGALLIQRKLPKYLKNKFIGDSKKIMDEIIESLPPTKARARNWVFKKIILKILPDLNWLRKNKKNYKREITYFSETEFFQSDLSKKILSLQIKKINKFIELRKSFSKTFSLISNSINLKNLYQDGAILYQIGLKINLESLKKMSKSKLNVISRKWPNLPFEVLMEPIKHKTAISMQDEFLFFPVHQHLDYKIIYNLGLDLVDNKNKEYKITRAGKSEWEELFNKCKNTNLLQTWCYGDAKQKLEGYNPGRFIIKSGSKIEAIFQVLKKSYGPISIYRLNRGPLFINDEIDYLSKINIFREIRKYYLIRKNRSLLIAPNLKRNSENISVLKNAGFRKRNQNIWNSYKIDLNKSIDDLRTKLNGKWRNQLKKAEKYNFNFVMNNSAETFDRLIEKYRENMIKKNFVGPDEKIFRSVFNGNQKSILIGNVLLNNHLIAINLITIYGKSSTYEIGWNSNEGRKKYANNFLLWNTIIKLKELGIENFDLGGINKKRNPGIAKFKNGMSGKEYTLAGEWF